MPGRSPDPGASRRRVSAVLRWRAAMHQRPATARLYRTGVAVVGGSVVALGAVLIPLPGPGWLIVFIGLSILASEFAWAERLLRYARDRVSAWTRWVASKSLVTRLLVGASGVAVLAGLVVAVALWQGAVPFVRTAQADEL